MIVGNKQRFAIEAEVETISDRWALGHFRLWIGDESVGNWEDTVDLKGCARWLRDLAEKPRDRYDQKLEGLQAPDIFHVLYDVVYGPSAISNPADQPVPYAYSRFHISHVGMSALERFDILLVKDRSGNEKCLWRESGEQRIHQQFLEPGEMESVMSLFCDQFEAVLAAASRGDHA